MPLERRQWITREMMEKEPSVLFVFGDNLERWGRGGQAREMRGMSNAIGLPTKRSPYKFLTDADAGEVAEIIRPDLVRLHKHVQAGGTVVWPMAGIGTGLAKLACQAPAIALMYENVLVMLKSAVKHK